MVHHTEKNPSPCCVIPLLEAEGEEEEEKI
jgi:hypothetical protein